MNAHLLRSRYISLYLGKTKKAIVNLFNSAVYSLNRIPYLKYEIMRYFETKKNGSVKPYINAGLYAKIAQMHHEKKFKLYNSDYGSVKIDWELYAGAYIKKQENKNIKPKSRYIAIQSTFDPTLNSRISMQ